MPWWQTSVLYQIYPRSFADSDGDGVGDLDGICTHLDYVSWLGVDGIWLSPIYRSPMADFGYDISDYCDVDPTFGDLAAFEKLLGDAHHHDLRLLLDWVPNHTSDRHPWFVDSRSSRDSAHRNWYVWRDGRADGAPPNNWRATFGGPAWTWDFHTEQWYLHLFLPEQPDLNWDNPDVVAAMQGVLRFWLDRGVDGFRADVIHLIGKDPALPDQPAELVDGGLVGVHDYPSTHELLRSIRSLLDSYPDDRAMIGEVNLSTAALLAPYYGARDELHLVFNFSLLYAPWQPKRWAELITEAETAFEPAEAWPVWVLSNHDTARLRTRYGGSEDRARVAAVVLLTLRGTPVLYAGEELGLEDGAVDEATRVDPGGRDGCRAPIPWTAAAPHGWEGQRPWLPWPPSPRTRNVEVFRRDENSILHLYRRLLGARRAAPALHKGAWRLLDAPAPVLAYERRDHEDVRITVANFGDEPVEVGNFGNAWRVDVASDRVRDGAPWDGRLGPDEALVLRPA
ncbi:MAG TPA: alpha-amylase family glycosyl hydrolase [Acidimicrobiales bacterium]|nr:alpha-amylase family glycosyl hydrolase [Acidimicrobiales bacterium]